MEEYAVTSVDGAFARSRERFESIVAGLGSPRTNVITHAELEERIGCQGRELLRCLLQDHLDLRTAREVRHAAVTGADAVVRRTVEPDHDRALSSVFGEVRVTRMAYRVRGSVNVYPIDAAPNLPIEKHSHGLRRPAVVESVRGSFEAAGAAVGRVTGHDPGKRQVETLAQEALAFQRVKSLLNSRRAHTEVLRQLRPGEDWRAGQELAEFSRSAGSKLTVMEPATSTVPVVPASSVVVST